MIQLFGIIVATRLEIIISLNFFYKFSTNHNEITKKIYNKYRKLYMIKIELSGVIKNQHTFLPRTHGAAKIYITCEAVHLL